MGSYLRAVRDNAGIIQSQPDRVLQVASDYFRAMVTADLPSAESAEVFAARDEI